MDHGILNHRLKFKKKGERERLVRRICRYLKLLTNNTELSTNKTVCIPSRYYRRMRTA